MRRRILSILLAVSLLIPSMPVMAAEVPAEEELVGASGVELTNDSSANFTNLVVFVEFQDTKDLHGGHSANCFRNAALSFKLFDGDGRNGSDQSRKSLKRYMETVSYGAVRVENIFPQYNGTEMVPLQLGQNSDYYYRNYTAMIQEIIAGIWVDEGIELDRWLSDGSLDNLNIVVPAGGAAFTGLHDSYIENGTINGVRVQNFTIVPEASSYSSSYSDLTGSNVVIHEFLHVLGYPDLYRKRGDTGNMPVGYWDIMATAGGWLQYPLAWLRSQVTGWFSMQTVTSSMTGCSLYAASAATAEVKNQQALILKTDYSDTEFFVVEYRKQGNWHTSTGQITDELECGLPGSGLIIYRVNIRYDTNVGGLPDMIYVFRPGDTYDNDGNEYGNGDLRSSFLSAESGRTSYGNADPETGLSEGAITYADGSNSGIVISNVGSAGGDQITFDITFSENSDYWKLISSEQDDSDSSADIASCLDDDGTMYYLQTKSNGSTYLYSYRDVWNRLGEAPPGRDYQLFKFKGSLYTGYSDKSFNVRLARWNGMNWEDIPIGQYQTYYGVRMTAGESGIYLSWMNVSDNRIYACEYDGSKVMSLGVVAESNGGAANPVIAAEDGKSVVMYRLAAENDRLVIKYYDSASGIWKEMSDAGFVGSGIVRINNGKIYLMKNDRISDDDYGMCVYTYDLNRNNGVWEQLGNRIYIKGNSVEMDIYFQEGQPYIVFMEGRESKFDTSVMHLVGGRWHQLGNKVANGTISRLKLYGFQNEIWVTYGMNHGSGENPDMKVYIKSHTSELSTQPLPTARPVEPTPEPTIEPEPDVTSEPTPANPTASAVPAKTPEPAPVVPTSAPAVPTTPSVTPRPTLTPGWPFYDVTVKPGNWKYESVKYVYENGIMVGTKADEFSPDAPLTRAMFASVLYRMAGSPAVVWKSIFPDVPAGKWYSNAVIWAYEEGIVAGMDGGARFGTHENITREQIARMLMEYARTRGLETGQRGELDGFADRTEVSRWAVDYVKWAVGCGMLSGKDVDGRRCLVPKGDATRAECASMLMRFIRNFG